jgi:hypothetical protein
MLPLSYTPSCNCFVLEPDLLKRSAEQSLAAATEKYCSREETANPTCPKSILD